MNKQEDQILENMIDSMDNIDEEENDDAFVDFDFETGKSVRKKEMTAFNHAAADMDKILSVITNYIAKVSKDPDSSVELIARLYNKLNVVQSVVSKNKKLIRDSVLKPLGDTDIIAGSQICELRNSTAESLDTASWKKNEPFEYSVIKGKWSKTTERMSVKFRSKLGAK